MSDNLPDTTRPLADDTMRKFDAPVLRSIRTSDLATPAAAFLPSNMAEAMELGKLMAASNVVPPHLRGRPGDCLAIVIIATRWEMDPFSVASKTYFVNERIAFEAQLVTAVLNTRAPLQKRLRLTFTGDGAARRCTVSGLLKGEVEPHEYQSPAIGSIQVKNSPLWKSDPDQQLGYFSTRAWARRHVPEVIMGVYSPDDLENGIGPENAHDVTPPRPTRAEFEKASAAAVSAPEPMVSVISAWGEQVAVVPADRFATEFAAQANLCQKPSDLETLWDNNLDVIDLHFAQGLDELNAIFKLNVARLVASIEPSAAKAEPSLADASRAAHKAKGEPGRLV